MMKKKLSYTNSTIVNLWKQYDIHKISIWKSIIVCSLIDAYNYHCYHTYNTWHKNTTSNQNELTCNNAKIEDHNIENQNICITKRTTKQKLCCGISNHQKWFENTQIGIISHDKYSEPRSHLN
jgi:hypothetical protein